MRQPITLETKWRFYRGCFHGLTAPTITGNARINLPKGWNAGIFSRQMQRVIDLEERNLNTGNESKEVLALSSLLFWANATQRINRVVVPEEFRIFSSQSDDSGVKIGFALPCVDTGCVVQTLHTLAGFFNVLVDSDSDLQTDEEARKTLGRLGAIHREFVLKGISMPNIYRAVFDNHLPIRRIGDDMAYVGMGENGFRFKRSMTDSTTSPGLIIARDKIETASALRRAGLPGAEHSLVSGEDELLQAADRIGYPLVVKPSNLDGGKGVFADIRSAASLKRCYAEALKYSKSILVEKFVAGWSHRVTVVDGDVVKINKKIPLGIWGDGRQSICQLVEAHNTRRIQLKRAQRRRPAEIAVDDEVRDILSENHMTLDTVLPDGHFLSLRRKSNSSQGGTAEGLGLDEIHADNRELCIAACETIGLDIAGVDIIIPDLGVSWRCSEALICEVNGMPQLGYEAADRLVEKRTGNRGRIPLGLLVYVDEAKDRVGDLLQLLAAKHGFNDIAHSSGVAFRGATWPGQFASDFDAADFAIFNERSSALLCAINEREILRDGLPCAYVSQIFTTEALSKAVKTALSLYGDSIVDVSAG